MEEELISFETAKLAKEKNFDIPSINIYPLVDFYKTYKKGKLSVLIEESLDEDHAWENNLFCYAPTQSLLQKWLREKHKLIISIQCVWNDLNKDSESYIPWVYYTKEEEKCGKKTEEPVFFETYEEALEGALKEALNEIKN